MYINIFKKENIKVVIDDVVLNQFTYAEIEEMKILRIFKYTK